MHHIKIDDLIAYALGILTTFFRKQVLRRMLAAFEWIVMSRIVDAEKEIISKVGKYIQSKLPKKEDKSNGT